MTDDLEPRVSAVEARIQGAEQDARAARHLAAAHDREISETGVVLNGIRSTLNALGQQTAERFAIVNDRFDAVDKRFNTVDQRFDAVDRRLDRMDERFDGMDERFDGMDKRFDAMDKRLDGMDHRFQNVDSRFDSLDSRFENLTEAVTVGFNHVDDLLTRLIDSRSPDR